MKLKEYQVIGIKHLRKEDKDKTYHILQMVGTSDMVGDTVEGQEVMTCFGNGKETIGDIIRGVSVDNRFVRIEE